MMERELAFRMVCKIHEASSVLVPRALKVFFPGSLTSWLWQQKLSSISLVFPDNCQAHKQFLFLIVRKPPQQLVNISKDFHDNNESRASPKTPVIATALGQCPRVLRGLWRSSPNLAEVLTLLETPDVDTVSLEPQQKGLGTWDECP